MVIPGTPPIPHVGGPVCGPCTPTVLIGGLPAAVVGDACVCVGPPDTIAQGSTTVLIGYKPAARMGDKTAHGGVIVAGYPKVLIGSAGKSGGGRGDGDSSSISGQKGTGGAIATSTSRKTMLPARNRNMAAASTDAFAAKSGSPTITHAELAGKSAPEIRALAAQKGLVAHPTKPDKWMDPITGKERLRIDPGHVSPKTGLPYNDPKAAAPHHHGYGSDGKTKIVNPADNNPHIPTRP